MAYNLTSKSSGQLTEEALPAAREQRLRLAPLSAKLIEFTW